MKKVFVFIILLFLPFCIDAEELQLNSFDSLGGSNLDNIQRLIANDDYLFGFGTFYSEDLSDSMGKSDIVMVKYDKEGNLLWQKSFGGSDYDYFDDAIITENNEILISGYFRSADIPGLENNGGSNALILKYDFDGNLLFSKSIGGEGVESLHSLYLVDDGYIIVGSFDSLNFESLQSKGSNDFYIIKYDKDWNVVWKNSWGGSKIESLTSTSISDKDDVIIAGYSYSKDIEGISINGSDDVVLLKYDKNGNLVFQKNWGGSGPEEFNDIIVCQDDSIIVGAITSSKDIFENEVNSNNLLVKYDKDGNIIFQKNLGGSSFDWLRLAFPMDDGFIMIGQYKSTDIEGLPNKGDSDGIIAKFDYDGNLIWHKGFGGSSSDKFSKAYLNANNEIIVFASYESTDIEGLENKGKSDVAILKYDRDGNLLLKNRWGGNDNDSFYSLALKNENEMYVSFSSNSTDIDNVENNGYSDAVLLKVFFKYDLQVNEDNSNGTSVVEQQGSLGMVRPVAEEGFEVDEVVVKDLSGNVLDVEVTVLEDGTYSFPLYTDVLIDVIYKEKIGNPKTGVFDYISFVMVGMLVCLIGYITISYQNRSFEL